LGVKAGWVEGLEINLLGLVAGHDLRQPGLKLPAFGHLGLAGATALAGPTPDAGPTAIPAERRRAREPGPT
ncbi:MAG: hypothetical protein ACJ8D9_19340, partial [Xanthobacteraceae bacterium]